MRTTPVLLAAAMVAAAPGAPAHEGQHPASGEAPHSTTATAGDARTLVAFPAPMREHMLANMRDHLAALQEINTALAVEDYGLAADIAEERLGLSSLERHGAGHMAGHMPGEMQAIGTAMHRAASRFAVAARDAGATGDVKPALAALAGVTARCVACHAAYRVH